MCVLRSIMSVVLSHKMSYNQTAGLNERPRRLQVTLASLSRDFFPHQLILSRKVHSDVNLISYCHVRVKQPLELIQFSTITDAWQQSLATSWIHFLYKLKYLSSTKSTQTNYLL